MNNNNVIILGYYGGDKSHCLSAWQSTVLELDINLPPKLSDRINYLHNSTVLVKKKSPEELLKYLAENDHHTPFEKSCIHFQIKADIATHIQLIKHRIGVSINSESARYKELKDKYYLPSDWANIKSKKHQKYWYDILDEYSELGHQLYHDAITEITPVLGRKRAKETARYFLPYNKQLDFDVMFNFRSFIHFQKLRNSDHAQKEIKNIASEMLTLVKSIEGDPFKLSLKAFGY